MGFVSKPLRTVFYDWACSATLQRWAARAVVRQLLPEQPCLTKALVLRRSQIAQLHVGIAKARTKRSWPTRGSSGMERCSSGSDIPSEDTSALTIWRTKLELHGPTDRSEAAIKRLGVRRTTDNL